MKFGFGNIVVVENVTEIGLIVKLWEPNKGEPNYDIYVRSFNGIKNYKESEINHFIYNKSLSEEEQFYYKSNEEQCKILGIDIEAIKKNLI